MKKVIYKNPLIKIISSYILLFTPFIFGDEGVFEEEKAEEFSELNSFF